MGIVYVLCRHPEETLCILWLGSSVGNLEPKETLQFFKDMLEVGGPKTEVCSTPLQAVGIGRRSDMSLKRVPPLLGYDSLTNPSGRRRLRMSLGTF
jgi:hypothetical protein